MELSYRQFHYGYNCVWVLVIAGIEYHNPGTSPVGTYTIYDPDESLQAFGWPTTLPIAHGTVNPDPPAQCPFDECT